MIFGQ